ncbi:MAG: alpha/beta hydrolase [Dongiaceae bacterium]
MDALHPEMRAIVERLSALPLPPLPQLSPAAARAQDAEHFDRPLNADPPAVAKVEDRVVPGPGGPIPVRLYDPGLAAPAPCLLYFHGGGFVLGGLASHDRLCRELALAGRVKVAAVDYRLAPEHRFPAALEDCVAAVAAIARDAAAWGVDPGRLATGGDSAGGNLALATLIALRDRGGPLPAAGLLVYGMLGGDPTTASQRRFGDGRYLLSTADLEWFWDCYLGPGAVRSDPLAVPLRADLAGLPPLYVAAAALDPLLDDSLQLVERLGAEGRPHRFALWPGLTHAAIQMSRELTPMRAHLAAIGEWLQETLGRG